MAAPCRKSIYVICYSAYAIVLPNQSRNSNAFRLAEMGAHRSHQIEECRIVMVTSLLGLIEN
jgi:hypothetical protein